jgi:hypothetical protein
VTIHAFCKQQKRRAPAGCGKSRSVESEENQKAGFPPFPPPLEIAHNPRDSHFSHSPDCCWYFYEPNN